MTDQDRPRGKHSTEGAATGDLGTPLAVTVESGGGKFIAVLLAGPVIWSVHFVIVYLVVEAGCTGSGPGLNRLDPPLPTLVTLIATLVAALACLATAFWGYRSWRRSRRVGTGDEDGGMEGPDPGGSLALAGLMLSLLGFVSVLFVGVPALVIRACLP